MHNCDPNETRTAYGKNGAYDETAYADPGGRPSQDPGGPKKSGPDRVITLLIILIAILLVIFVLLAVYIGIRNSRAESGGTGTETEQEEDSSEAAKEEEPEETAADETCSHEWAAATCTEPKTCSLCGETEGEPLGHDFEGGTCTEPACCTRCGAITEAPGHTWAEATCTEPETCTVCGETEGEPLGHDYVKGVCARCGEEDPDYIDLSGYAVGDIFSFGSYESGGAGPDPVQWKVLAVEDDRMLVVSFYCLDAKEYDESHTADSWADCSLRSWLNGSFLNTAFTDAEQNMILSTDHSGASDQVFLLSESEAKTYLGAGILYADGASGNYRDLYTGAMASATDYAIDQGIGLSSSNSDSFVRNNYVTSGGPTASWWLRDYVGGGHGAFICGNGAIYETAQLGSSDYCGTYGSMLGVRPAMWISIG